MTPSSSSTGNTACRRWAQRTRRTLATVGVAGAVVLGGSLSLAPAASAAPQQAGVVASLPAWCPLGTHHGAGSGCRGGSINDNERVNDAAKATGREYLDAAECAGKAVGSSVWKNRKKPNLPGIALGTVSPALKCGASKGY